MTIQFPRRISRRRFLSTAAATGVSTLALPYLDGSGGSGPDLWYRVTAVNADGTTGLPMPTTMIVDAERVVRWVDVHLGYTTRSEPGEILAALDAVAPR